MDKKTVTICTSVLLFISMLFAAMLVEERDNRQHQLDMLKAGASACEAILSTK